MRGGGGVSIQIQYGEHSRNQIPSPSDSNLFSLVVVYKNCDLLWTIQTDWYDWFI